MNEVECWHYSLLHLTFAASSAVGRCAAALHFVGLNSGNCQWLAPCNTFSWRAHFPKCLTLVKIKKESIAALAPGCDIWWYLRVTFEATWNNQYSSSSIAALCITSHFAGYYLCLELGIVRRMKECGTCGCTFLIWTLGPRTNQLLYRTLDEPKTSFPRWQHARWMLVDAQVCHRLLWKVATFAMQCFKGSMSLSTCKLPQNVAWP